MEEIDDTINILINNGWFNEKLKNKHIKYLRNHLKTIVNYQVARAIINEKYKYKIKKTNERI